MGIAHELPDGFADIHDEGLKAQVHPPVRHALLQALIMVGETPATTDTSPGISRPDLNPDEPDYFSHLGES